jgi:hypothetical protein
MRLLDVAIDLAVRVLVGGLSYYGSIDEPEVVLSRMAASGYFASGVRRRAGGQLLRITSSTSSTGKILP